MFCRCNKNTSYKCTDPLLLAFCSAWRIVRAHIRLCGYSPIRDEDLWYWSGFETSLPILPSDWTWNHVLFYMAYMEWNHVLFCMAYLEWNHVILYMENHGIELCNLFLGYMEWNHILLYLECNHILLYLEWNHILLYLEWNHIILYLEWNHILLYLEWNHMLLYLE